MLDAISTFGNHNSLPQIGDISICIECGQLLQLVDSGFAIIDIDKLREFVKLNQFNPHDFVGLMYVREKIIAENTKNKRKHKK